jgi:hypothetical protein
MIAFMAALHVRDLDDAVLEELKKRAERHRRSLQKEVVAILEAAARPRGRSRRGGKPRPLKIHTVRVGGPATYSRDKIYDDDGR